MNTDELIRGILDQVASGSLSAADAAESLKTHLGAARNLGFARVDVGRESRTGFPEVIYGDGKEPEQIAAIAAEIFSHSGMVLVTRTTREALEEVRKHIPSAQYHTSARVIWADERDAGPKLEGVTVACAGTSDLPVAEEAAITATLMGCEVERVNDIGIAGLHRLQPARGPAAGPRAGGCGRNGGRPAQRGRRPRESSGDRRAHQRGLRGQSRRRHRPPGDVEFVFTRCDGGEHRQRICGRLYGRPDRPGVGFRELRQLAGRPTGGQLAVVRLRQSLQVGDQVRHVLVRESHDRRH